MSHLIWLVHWCFRFLFADTELAPVPGTIQKKWRGFVSWVEYILWRRSTYAICVDKPPNSPEIDDDGFVPACIVFGYCLHLLNKAALNQGIQGNKQILLVLSLEKKWRASSSCCAEVIRNLAELYDWLLIPRRGAVAAASQSRRAVASADKFQSQSLACGTCTVMTILAFWSTLSTLTLTSSSSLWSFFMRIRCLRKRTNDPACYCDATTHMPRGSTTSIPWMVGSPQAGLTALRMVDSEQAGLMAL